MQGIRIEFVSNTIVITKAFREAASDMDSEEYRALNKAKEENPGMRVVLKSGNVVHCRNNCKGLTYKFMRKFIKTIDEKNLIAFEGTIEYYEGLYRETGKVYQCVKDWFIENYPHYKELVTDAAPKRVVAT